MKIYTLTLSPAYDVHAYADVLTCGRENLVRIESRDAGGKGVNVSRALLAKGTPSKAIILVGEENSAEFREKIRGDGIDAEFISVSGRIRENLTIHTPVGETRISTESSDVTQDVISKIESALECAEENDTVTLTGRVPSGISLSSVKKLLIRLKKRGVLTVIDSRSFTLDDLSETSPWLIKPNEEEISEYFGRSVKSFDDARICAEKLRKSGILNVMISLGGRGALLCNDEGVFMATPPKIEVKSTIGAGDSMIAGFISAIADGESARCALVTAVAFGSAACLTDGTAPPRSEDIEDIKNHIKSS